MSKKDDDEKNGVKDEGKTVPLPEEPRLGRQDQRALRLRAVTVTEAGSASFALPPLGRVTIGRGEDADVRLEDPSAGRRHAQLIIDEDGVRLRDLGSVNGTSFRGRKLGQDESVVVSVGDAIEVGNSLVVLQEDRLSDEERPWKLLTHFQFLDAIDDTAAPFAVVRLQIAARPGLAQQVLSAELRPEDTVASFGPGSFEVLAPGLDAKKAAALEERLRVKLLAAGATRVRGGYAVAPRDGSDADDLLSACSRPAAALAPGYVVRDDTMTAIHRLVDRVAPSLINVLLLGDPGVGKEVLARLVQQRSRRASGPYQCFNCAALTESLLEAELFGHEKAIFTGADKQRIGLLESANGGTVFLDEIGEMSPSMQAKLLRVLEEKTIRRVGGNEEIPIDVRFIFATNRDLEAEVERGAFRADLYYRVNGISVVIPPLRERVSEIEALAQTFIAGFSASENIPAPDLSPEALAALKAWHWPGNVRELRHCMHRAVMLCGDRAIRPSDLGLGPAAPRATAGTPAAGTQAVGVRPAIEEVERRLMVQALQEAANNHTLAARNMDWSRRKWTERAKRYGLQKKDS